MSATKSKSMYTESPTPPLAQPRTDIEKRSVSYWLEKLLIQGEKIRKDNNRREEQAGKDSSIPPIQADMRAIANPENTESGINEFAKNAVTKDASDRHTVDDLVRKSNRSIITISSQFPWDLFPNTIDVEESKVTVKFRQFLSSQTHSVDIKDISNVFLESSVFFTTLQIISRTYIENEIRVGYLNKNKAKKVQKVIEGLRTLVANDINTSNYEIDELIAKIEAFNTTPITNLKSKI